MWSGPRNISTALMRSFGSRADTLVCDEPLYAHYLAQTGLPHPVAQAIQEQHETDWRRVVAWLTGPLPAGKRVFYQKHMAHHLLEEIERDWLDALTHVFLIRDPRRMLPSLDTVVPNPRLVDTGLPQQVELFEHVADTSGSPPPVVDSAELLQDPEGVLRALCPRIGLAFEPAMLAWAPGPRDTDGCWGEHWYANTWASTGFAPWKPDTRPLPEHLSTLLDECTPLYERLHAHRITS